MLGRSGKAVERDRGPKGSPGELNKLEGSRQKGLGLASFGVGGLSRSPSLLCRTIRNDTLLQARGLPCRPWPFPDAGTWRGCWRQFGECPVVQPQPSSYLSSFGVFSEPGVVRISGLGPWSHPSCGGTAVAFSCIRTRHTPSFLRSTASTVMCNAARGCEMQQSSPGSQFPVP